MSEKPFQASSPNSILKNIHVAAPCTESWEKMAGGDQIRACERCQHRVYNLSEMTDKEATDLIRKTEGRLCVRFYRRPDGTIMTKDCPVGLAAVRQRAARATAIAFTTVAMACGATFIGKPRAEQPQWVRWVMNRLAPEPELLPATGPISLPMIPIGPATMGTPAPPHVTMGKPARIEPMMGEMVIQRPVIKKK